MNNKDLGTVSFRNQRSGDKKQDLTAFKNL